MNSKGGIWAVLALMQLIAMTGGCSSGKLATMVVDVAGVEVVVEVADTQESRSQGLMFRRSMPENHGMLFVFDYESQVSFWMKDTRIPLSIAFIAADGTIRQIEDMEAESLSSVVSERNVLYALEMNQGWFGKNGIEPGDRVLLPSD